MRSTPRWPCSTPPASTHSRLPRRPLRQPAREGGAGFEDDELIDRAVAAGATSRRCAADRGQGLRAVDQERHRQMSQDGYNSTRPSSSTVRTPTGRSWPSCSSSPPGTPGHGIVRPSEALPHSADEHGELHHRPAEGRAARPPRRVSVPRIVSELAARHPGAGVPSDLEQLREFFTFRDFAHFVDVYLSVVDLVRTPEDVRLLTYEVAREMAQAQNLRYAELTCTPYTSVLRGIAIEALHRGHRGRPRGRRAGLRPGAALGLRHPGESGLPAADATLDYALNHRRTRWSGSGSAGGDRGAATAVPAALRRGPGGGAALGAARGGDDRARDRLGLAAPARRRTDRARHLQRPGPRAARAPRRQGVVLEVCPTSNVATRAVDGSRTTRCAPSSRPASP